MIRLMVISPASEKLKAFLDSRGAFIVENCYENFTFNEKSLVDVLVDVDKTLFILPQECDEDTARHEFRCLGRLLADKTFFKPGEFNIFFSEKNVKYEPLFSAVIRSSGYTNYKVHKVGVLSYDKLYSILVGESSDISVTNSSRNIYRVRKGTEADLAFTEHKDRNLVISPFSMTEMRSYESRKNALRNTVSDPVEELGSDVNVNKVDEGAEAIETVETTDDRTVDLIVTGRPGSGKSIWASVLATGIAEKYKVLVIDMTATKDMLKTMKGTSWTVKKIEEKAILEKTELREGQITLCETDTFALALYAARKFNTIIVIDYDKYKDYEDFVEEFNVVVTSGGRLCDVEVLGKLSDHCILVLNSEHGEANDIKEHCKVPVVRPKQFMVPEGNWDLVRALFGTDEVRK